jgi:hypothetical protein
MDLNQKVIARAGYTSLDWISDVGGMQGMIISGIALFLAMWNYNMLENHLVSRLYTLERSDENSDNPRNDFFDR